MAVIGGYVSVVAGSVCNVADLENVCFLLMEKGEFPLKETSRSF